MDFESSSYGLDKAGLLKYEADLNAIVLTKVATTISDTDLVKQALNSGWHGAACDNFKKALEESAAGLVDTLSQLSTEFHSELIQIKTAIAEMDSGMFSDGISEGL